jgi:hypothetical protein
MHYKISEWHDTLLSLVAMRTTIKAEVVALQIGRLTSRRVRRYFTQDSTILGVDVHG